MLGSFADVAVRDGKTKREARKLLACMIAFQLVFALGAHIAPLMPHRSSSTGVYGGGLSSTFADRLLTQALEGYDFNTGAPANRRSSGNTVTRYRRQLNEYRNEMNVCHSLPEVKYAGKA